MARILIVDDDQAVVRLLALVLTLEEYEVERAYDGDEGLSFFQNGSPPDLVLLDLRMPGMDGQTFLKTVRSLGYSGPVMICSAYGAEAAARELGAQAAISKPFEPAMLVNQVKELLFQNG